MINYLVDLEKTLFQEEKEMTYWLVIKVTMNLDMRISMEVKSKTEMTFLMEA